MSENQHYEYATAAFSSANARAGAEFNAEARADAQIQATLAIAYEQRTANLIAIWQTGDIKVAGGTYGITMERRVSIYNEICQRMGMDK